MINSRHLCAESFNHISGQMVKSDLEPVILHDRENEIPSFILREKMEIFSYLDRSWPCFLITIDFRS